MHVILANQKQRKILNEWYYLYGASNAMKDLLHVMPFSLFKLTDSSDRMCKKWSSLCFMWTSWRAEWPGNHAGGCCFESAALFLGELPVIIHWFSNHQDWGLASYELHILSFISFLFNFICLISKLFSLLGSTYVQSLWSSFFIYYFYLHQPLLHFIHFYLFWVYLHFIFIYLYHSTPFYTLLSLSGLP